MTTIYCDSKTRDCETCTVNELWQEENVNKNTPCSLLVFSYVFGWDKQFNVMSLLVMLYCTILGAEYEQWLNTINKRSQ